MELSITTPALLFPAISLLMLAYTNRFLAIANLIRSLHAKYKQFPDDKHIITQIQNLRIRIRLIRSMQAIGVLSFLFCVMCMFTIFRGWDRGELHCFWYQHLLFYRFADNFACRNNLSMRALEVELSDIEELTKSNFFKDMIGKNRLRIVELHHRRIFIIVIIFYKEIQVQCAAESHQPWLKNDKRSDCNSHPPEKPVVFYRDTNDHPPQ